MKRVYYLYQGKIENIQTDNGSEFQDYFQKAINQELQKDNPVNEDFNGTLQKEFIKLGNFTPDIKLFNKRLTKWLIEYNFHRPYQALGYQTPIDFHFQYHKALPMCLSNVNY